MIQCILPRPLSKSAREKVQTRATRATHPFTLNSAFQQDFILKACHQSYLGGLCSINHTLLSNLPDVEIFASLLSSTGSIPVFFDPRKEKNLDACAACTFSVIPYNLVHSFILFLSPSFQVSRMPNICYVIRPK